MTERGMIFNAEMVRAILDIRKTQTRQIVNWRGLCEGLNLSFSGLKVCEYPKGWVIESESRSSSEWRCQPTPCPFGQPGDRIWLRETQAEAGGIAPELQLYRANYPEHVPSRYENLKPAREIRWTPSIHMPRCASRITLEITDVRVEQLKHVPRAGIIAEGYPAERAANGGEYDPFLWYRDLQESIYGEGSWQANPWVWVIEFTLISKEAQL